MAQKTDYKSDKFGSRWTEDDNSRLFELLKEGKDYTDISEELNRTVRAIEIRIEKSMHHYYTKKNYSVDDLHDLTGLKKEDITLMIAKNFSNQNSDAKSSRDEKMKSSHPSKKEVNSVPLDKELLSLLKEINEKLSVLVEKMH